MRINLVGTVGEITHHFKQLHPDDQITLEATVNGFKPAILTIPAEAVGVVKPKRHISAKGRRAMKLAQRKRWANVKKALSK